MFKIRLFLQVASIFWLSAVLLPTGFAQEFVGEEASSDGVVLTRAVMCEGIVDYGPNNTAAVFSVNVGKISCFTAFEGIKSATFAVHKWYRHDELVTTKKLTLKPPRWATYSSIQLREADKGPWRVEVLDVNDKLLKTIRFSVTE